MPCTLTRQEAYQAARAWISANLILQTLSPEDVIEIATSMRPEAV